MAGMSIPGNSCRSCVTPINQGCPIRLSDLCVYYSGPPISPGINTGNNLDVVINKLSVAISTSTTPPAGVSNDIQINEGGSFAADTGAFTYNPDDGSFSTPAMQANNTNFTWAGAGDTFIAGQTGLFYTNTNGDRFRVNNHELSYVSDNDAIDVNNGYSYVNINTSENFTLSGGLNYIHPNGANFAVDTFGRTSINLPSGSPTALLHVGPGNDTIGPPIKLIAGSLVTSPQNGALEFDGTHLYFTIGSTRTIII